MTRLVVLALVVIALATPSRAQVGRLGVYPDDQGGCVLVDPGGFIKTYLVHQFSGGEESIGSRFRVEPPAGASWTYITIVSPYTTTGSALYDVSIGYGVCQTTTTVVGYVLWNSAAPSPCGLVTIQAGLPGIIGLACNFAEYPLRTQPLYVNCPCPNPVEAATWGKVKSLYR